MFCSSTLGAEKGTFVLVGLLELAGFAFFYGPSFFFNTECDVCKIREVYREKIDIKNRIPNENINVAHFCKK